MQRSSVLGVQWGFVSDRLAHFHGEKAGGVEETYEPPEGAEMPIQAI